VNILTVVYTQVCIRRANKRQEKHKNAVLDMAAGHLHQGLSQQASKLSEVERACSSICNQTHELRAELSIALQESARLYTAMFLVCEAREAHVEAAYKV
jgi:hypothetical protein